MLAVLGCVLGTALVMFVFAVMEGDRSWRPFAVYTLVFSVIGIATAAVWGW